MTGAGFRLPAWLALRAQGRGVRGRLRLGRKGEMGKCFGRGYVRFGDTADPASDVSTMSIPASLTWPADDEFEKRGGEPPPWHRASGADLTSRIA